MLQFFRKYQKAFLIVVTFFIVVSFVFFGTSSAITQRSEELNWEIGHLIDGSPLMSKDLYGMKRLIFGGLEEGGRGVNLLSGSIAHHKILLTGQGEQLAANFFEHLEPELSERWKRVKQYVPYSHPYSPYISAVSVWNQFAPEMVDLLNQVALAPSEFTQEELPLLFKLYQAQAAFPSQMLHRVLYFQERQTEEIRPDPGLPGAHLALFGFDSIEDWYGSKFTELVSQFILNSARLARAEGYQVGSEEAKMELYRNVQRGLKAYQQGEELSGEDLHKYYAHGIRSLGLTEKEAISLWQNVLLYTRYVEEVKGGILVDRLALNQFKSSAKSIYKIEEYSLPRQFRLTQFRQLLGLQAYLEAVGEGENFTRYPKQKSLEEIQKTAPELVVKWADLEIASISKQEAAAKLTLKQTWDWEREAENFTLLQAAFPQLGTTGKESDLERIEALENLDKRVRFEVDQFARLALIEHRPELIDEALGDAPMNTQTLAIPLKGASPFSGAEFLEMVETGDLRLSRYTQDGETFYQIRVLKHDGEFSVLSYEEASHQGILDQMVDHLVEVAYEAGNYKASIDGVREELEKGLFPKLLAKIEAVGGRAYSNVDGYALHRFDGYLAAMRKSIIQGLEVRQSPWSLQVRELIEENLDSSLTVGEFSPVLDHRFFKLLEKEEGSVSEEELAAVQEVLKKEAEKVWLDQVVRQIETHLVF